MKNKRRTNTKEGFFRRHQGRESEEKRRGRKEKETRLNEDNEEKIKIKIFFCNV